MPTCQVVVHRQPPEEGKLVRSATSIGITHKSDVIVRCRSIAVGLRGIRLAVCAKLRGEGILRCDIDVLITAGAE